MSDRKPPKNTKAGDYLILLKPGITWMSVFMALGGIGLAPGTIDQVRAVWALVGIALIVASSHALNMYVERDTDALMERTKNRPLPAKRMRPLEALLFGAALGAAGVGVLFFLVNELTAYLGAFAMVIYVLVYTPLKRVTPLALLVGAVPGAFPPLLGWTSVTGRIAVPGLLLFFIMLLWQVPHFIAITLYRKSEYARAGIRTTSVVHGDIVAKLQALAYATLLVPISLLFVPLGLAGTTYFAIGLTANLAFVAMSATGFLPRSGDRWARGLFKASLIYLPVLTLGLMLDLVIQ
ncbi:MAG: heme o synthase [Deltaproteobacteria bacterium]|nr:heme o synthase [Deltaproteobacteria bacterium]